jgi:hypothetical protein
MLQSGGGDYIDRNSTAVRGFMSASMFTPEDRTMFDEVATLTLRVARPLVWHDRTQGWPKSLDGATCFFLRFEQGVVGVTAHHVVRAYEAAIAANQNIICQLRTSPAFDLMAAIIDRDVVRDIATFRVSEDILRQTEAVALDCRGDWPPPTPDSLRALSICGFPEEMRTTTADRTAEFAAWGALAAVESITEREILVTYDPARDQPARWAAALPPVGLNLSGCSGGPVLMHGTRNGLHRWFPVGLVVAGPRDQGTGASAEFDMIRLRRIHVIQRDGSIDKDGAGWLPA